MGTVRESERCSGCVALVTVTWMAALRGQVPEPLP